jgi:hypothetical protein
MASPCRFSSKRKFESSKGWRTGQLGGIHSRRAHKYWMRLERGGAKRRKGEPGSLAATGTLVA